tara:strand:- start:148 stop:318 length:171 start_codon:yes stop_codon:yes gene_type:complete
MGDFQVPVENFAAWKAFLWCFYPVAALLLLELISRGFDDDDDQGGGMMIPAYQGSR